MRAACQDPSQRVRGRELADSLDDAVRRRDVLHRKVVVQRNEVDIAPQGRIGKYRL